MGPQSMNDNRYDVYSQSVAVYDGMWRPQKQWRRRPNHELEKTSLGFVLFFFYGQ